MFILLLFFYENNCALCPTGGVFSQTEMSEVLTEILKADPNFSKQEFLNLCEYEIIPNVLAVSPVIKMEKTES